MVVCKEGGGGPIETEYNEQHSKPIDSFRPNIATFQRVWQLLFFFLERQLLQCPLRLGSMAYGKLENGNNYNNNGRSDKTDDQCTWSVWPRANHKLPDLKKKAK